MNRAATNPAIEPTVWSTALSTEQLRFYFLHEMNPADPDIYICRTMRITGVLDVDLLRASVADMARRHDILRSYYPMIDGQPQIWLRDQVDAAWAAIDLSRLPPHERTIRSRELVEAETRSFTPFRIDEGPLFRVTAIRLGETAYIVTFRVHHIVLDGASVRMFLAGLWETYIALSRGKHLDGEMHQFRDFVAWEPKRLADPARASDRDYWARKLARPTVLELPSDKPRPERHTREAGTVFAVASPELVASLRTTCRSLQVTPYVAMMAVFQILLHKVAGKHDVLVGSPIASRQRVEYQSMLGVLLNWVAFRTHVDPAMTFRQVLAHVRGDFPDAYVRQCSYESLLLAAGNLPRDPARNPLFQATLNYATYRELPAPAGLSISVDPIVLDHTHYDLSVRFEEVGAALSVGLTYYTRAIDPAVADKLCAALLALAERCLAHPDERIADLPLAVAFGEAPQALREVVIASTFTAEQIEPAVAFWLDQVGIRAELAFAPHNQVFQALLPPDGLIATNKLGTNVILVRWEDWKDPAVAVHELCRLLSAHAARSPAETVVVVCPPSPAHRADATALFEQELVRMAEATSRVHVVSWRDILAVYPVAVIDDAESDAYAKAPYAEDFNIALGTAIARKIHAITRPGPKVLVLDCDNTLWRGVVGEDGPHGIVIDDGRKKLQELALDRLGAGVLLAIISKNNEPDVWEAFAAPGMVLRRDHVVAHRINWDSKSKNLMSLADELKLGLESFVFVDDSPVECAEVRAACPDVTVLQLPAENAAIAGFLDHLWPLDRRKVTDTDRKRAELYVANARREQLRAETTDIQQFITSLEVRVTFVAFSPDTEARASQLSQRTNQFNTTTIRRSEADLRDLVERGGGVLLADVSDRFGDYGIVGLVTYRPGVDALDVDALMVSCRALGRGVEQQLLVALGRIAAERGLARVDIAFRGSAKNRPALDFLDMIAREHHVDGADGAHTYRIPRADALAAATRLAPPATRQQDSAAQAPAPSDPDVSPEVWREVAETLHTVPRIREAVHARLARARDAWSGYVAPRGELEESIARIWSEVLLVDPIGADDDYFAIGGDSIRSLTVVSKMRRAGLPVAVLDIHDHPTVARLAEVIRGRSAAPDPAPEGAVSTSSGPYPLSFSQRYVIGVYAQENLRETGDPTGAYHIQDRVSLRARRGRHSIEALRRAIELAVGRTPQLRTQIVRAGDTWHQVETDVRPQLEIVDVSKLRTDQQQDRINKLLFDDRMRPFDPERGAPMVRLYAIVRGSAELELLVTAHHGFCDGWSLQGFYNHLFGLYEAFTRGDDARVAEIDRALAMHESGFREVVHREQRASSLAELDAFWRAYLPGRVRVPVAPRTSRRGYQQRLIAHGDWKVIERANERAKASRTSLKAVLVDAFSTALVDRLDRRSSPVLAVVTNGRKDDLVAPTEVFGLCWTFVPIVVGEGDRSTRLASLHRDLIATEAHARYPIEGMFHGFDPDTTVCASFNLTNFHNSSWRNGTQELEIAQAESFHRFHFPLNLNIRLVESTRTVVLKLTWAQEAFDKQLVEGLLDQLATVG